MKNGVSPAAGVDRTVRVPSRRKSAWIALRGAIGESAVVKAALVSGIAGLVRFVGVTNRPVPGSVDLSEALPALKPCIFALWHGQHLMVPALDRHDYDFVALVSRSKDAELNARVLEKIGISVVRGSGGRERTKSVEKGGARALIALKKALDADKFVVMIADIPHGTPRDAGMGIVTLARISGRPIVPAACVTSRRKVLEKSWDKTTINLPFGRRALVLGDPIEVPADASEQIMEEARQAVTRGLDAVTGKAYALVDSSA
ncbi:MAG: lysophospholipid acyltransferase family protein [Rhizobiaceae bacterium]|nr:lysophospholipid acyltransferase family protein [Rhizobiaceae bacterium]MCV0406168.1 lysophospholipid acyltransferase family protein [Rhizobiaceae bacterium]